MPTPRRNGDGTYREFRYYSPTLGGEASRLSMFNGAGSEFWITLRTLTGKAWRDLKADAVSKIADTIEEGGEPGEIRYP